MKVRKAGPQDFDFLCEAQAASELPGTTVEPMELAAALSAGVVMFFLVEYDGCATYTVGVQIINNTAVVCALYRCGGTNFLGESRTLLAHLLAHLRFRGIEEIFACVGWAHPRREALMRFYERLGFEPEQVRMRLRGES